MPHRGQREDPTFETLAIPFPFDNEAFGFAGGHVYGRAGWPEPQSRLLRPVFQLIQVSSSMLSTEEGKQALVEPVLDPAAHDGYRFKIRAGRTHSATLEHVKEEAKSSRSSNVVCLLARPPITPDHVRSEAKAKRMSARLGQHLA